VRIFGARSYSEEALSYEEALALTEEFGLEPFTDLRLTEEILAGI